MKAYLGLVRDIYVLAVILVASYWDLKKREIEPVYWLYASAISVLLSFLGLQVEGITLNYLYVYLVLSGIAIALLGTLYMVGYMGGADLYALVFITLSMPVPLFASSLIPVPLLTVLYSALSSIAVPFYFCFHNLTHNYGVLRRSTYKRKLVLCFLGTPQTVRDYIRGKGFWFPLTVPGEEESVRYTFDIEEEPEEHRAKLKSMVDKGLVSENDYVWVTMGLPYVVFILIGYVLSIIIGDYPFTLLFGGS